MRYYLVLVILFSLFPVGLHSIALGSAAYLWINIFRPLSFAYLPTGPQANLAIGILLLSFFINLGRGRFSVKPNIFVTLSLGFLLWAFICALTSKYRPYTENYYILILKYVVPILFISMSLNTYNSVKIVMIGVLAAVGIWAAHTGLICLLNGVQIYMGIRGGQLGERNSFAGAIVALLPIQIYCIHIYNWKFKKFSKIFLSVILFLFLSAVVLSDSRGAIVGLAVSIMIYVIVLSKTKARDFIIFSILVCISIFFLPKSLFERMSTIEISMEQTEKSAADRMRNMIGAWEGTKDNPIYGMGPGCWILEANNYTGRHLEPHCIWLKVSVEYGFPGLLLYILIFIVTLFRLNKYRMIARDNLGNNDIYLMATILAISLSASMVTQSFGNAVFSEFMWSLLAISNSLCNIIKEENNFLYLPNGSTDD